MPGYHIEDQKPGAKKCGHQGGKVLVGQDEQNKRLNAARLQLDIMRVPGIIVARTDAEAATFLDNRTDERDQPFILGATNLELPSYRVGFLAILKSLHDLGLDEIRGHLLFAVPEARVAAGRSPGLARVGLMSLIERSAESARDDAAGTAIESPARRHRHPVLGDLAGGSGPQDLRRGGRRDPRAPRRRRRAVRDDARGMARLREGRGVLGGP